MGRGNPVNGGSGDELSRIKQLASQLHESSNEMKKNGRWTVRQVSDHIKVHMQFEKAIDDLHQHEIGKQLPADIDAIHILEESRELINLFQSTLDSDYASGSSGQNSPEISTTSSASSKSSNEEIEKTFVYGMSLNDIEETLRSSLNITEKQLAKEAIESAFKKEIQKESILKNELEKMVMDLGLDIKEISSDDMKVLVSSLIINRNDTKTMTKGKVQTAIFNLFLPYVSKKNKTEKNYDIELQKFYKGRLKESLITEKTASAIDKMTDLSIGELIFLQSKLEDKSSLFFQILDQKINSLLTDHFSQICHQIEAMKSTESNLEEVEKSIIDAMGILNYLSKNLPVNAENDEVWMDLHQSFHKILVLKAGASKTVQDVIGKVFQQFETFIEDGIITYLILNGGGGAEQTTERIFGRTKAEMEKIKVRNREAAAKKIVELAEKIKAGAPITVEMLSELHRVNNKNIVPKIASQLRWSGEIATTFGKRIGLIAEDIRPALEDIFSRADHILKRDEGWGLVSYFTSSLEIAMLHNEILDIHPFIDRNGSTALLFVELMMAVKTGYTPSLERSNHYYRNLTHILNNSVLGAAIVATEHYKIAYVPGHYESRVIELTEEKRKQYASLAALRY